MNRRTSYFKRFKLDKTRNKPITRRATIFYPEHFKVSNRMEEEARKAEVFIILVKPMVTPRVS